MQELEKASKQSRDCCAEILKKINEGNKQMSNFIDWKTHELKKAEDDSAATAAAKEKESAAETSSKKTKESSFLSEPEEKDGGLGRDEGTFYVIRNGISILTSFFIIYFHSSFFQFFLRHS